MVSFGHFGFEKAVCGTLGGLRAVLFSFKAQINKLFCFYCAISDGQALILLEKWKSETQAFLFLRRLLCL